MFFPFRCFLFVIVTHSIFECVAAEELSLEYGGRWNSEVVSERCKEWKDGVAIARILADHQGVVWAASDTGVTVFNGVERAPVALPEAARGKPILALCEDVEAARIYFLTADGIGSIPRSGGSGEFFEISALGSLRDLVLADCGSLFVASDRGVASVSFQGHQLTATTVLLETESARRLLLDRKDPGLLWVCDEVRGVFRLSLEENTSELFPLEKGAPGVLSLCQDEGGAIWLGGHNQIGVLRGADLAIWKYRPSDSSGDVDFSALSYDPVHDRIWVGTNQEQGLLSFVPESNALMHHGASVELRKTKRKLRVNDVCIDPSGVLWMATHKKGVVRTNTAALPWVVHRSSAKNRSGSLAVGGVLSLHGSREEIYVHSAGGLSRLDRESGRVRRFEPVGKDHLLAVSDKGKETMYGVFPTGIREVIANEEEPIRWGELKRFPFQKRLKNAKCILASENGRDAWIVADFVVLYFDGERFKRVGGPSFRYVASKMVVFGDTLWVSAKNYLYEVNKEEMLLHEHPLGPGIDSADMVGNFAETTLWIGYSSGIYRFHTIERKGEVAIKVENGVRSLCRAKKGRLWFLSGDEVYCFDPRVSDVVPFALQSQLSKAVDQANVIRSTDYGEISVASSGVTLFTMREADLFDAGSHLAPLLFTGYEVLDRNPETVSESHNTGFSLGTILLPADAFGIRLQFSIPDFRSPETNRFEYRVGGEDWQVADRGRVELTNLEKANGTLYVRGYNSAGMPTANDVKIHLKSMPYFWEKPSFYVGIGLVLFLILGGLYSWRTSVIMKANEKLVASNQALAESEGCYRRIFDHSTDAMFLTDEDCKILNSNPSAKKLIGTLTDKPWETVVSVCQFAADVDAFRSLVQKAGEGVVIENEPIQFVDEQSKPVEVLVSIVKADDEGSQWQFQIRDITRQCELEAQIRQAQKMEAVGTLAGGIAHDFNNLLSPIAIHSQLAKSSLEENGADAIPEAIDAFETCEEAARKAADLVKGLLHFAKKSDEGCRVGDLVPMVQEATRLLRGSVASNVSFDVDLPDTVVPIHCSEQRLEQALMNLVVNAGHAIGNATGSISIGLRRATVEDPILPELLPFDGWALSVTDTGKGMDEETLRKVFDPFFTTKGEDGGTGLGLATVHSFADECGGFVHVSSEVGKGTCFQIFLPETKETIADLDENSPVRGRLNFEAETKKESLRVMVVDDSRAVLFASTKMLEKFGHQVTGFSNPEEALQFYSSNFRDIDVVVSDQMMPEMTGLDLARGIHEVTPDTKVVLLTGFSQIDLEDENVSRDIAKVHMKPLDYSDLNETLCLLTGNDLGSSVALPS